MIQERRLPARVAKMFLGSGRGQIRARLQVTHREDSSQTARSFLLAGGL